MQLIPAASGEGTLREDYSRALLILMAMAAVVLFVGCVNLANLQLSRLLSRQRELVVRASLGASRWRILRQLLVEDLLLAVIGTVLAVGVGNVSSALLLRWASGSDDAISLDLHLGWEMFAVAAALLLAALAAFSLLPAWRTTGRNLTGNLASRANPSLQGKSAGRLSSLLLAGQVSLFHSARWHGGTVRTDAAQSRSHRRGARPRSCGLRAPRFLARRVLRQSSAGPLCADDGAAEGIAGRERCGGEHVRDSRLHLEHRHSCGRTSGNSGEADARRRKSRGRGILSHDGNSDFARKRIRGARSAVIAASCGAESCVRAAAVRGRKPDRTQDRLRSRAERCGLRDRGRSGRRASR